MKPLELLINHNSLGQLTNQSRLGVLERRGFKESVRVKRKRMFVFLTSNHIIADPKNEMMKISITSELYKSFSTKTECFRQTVRMKAEHNFLLFVHLCILLFFFCKELIIIVIIKHVMTQMSTGSRAEKLRQKAAQLELPPTGWCNGVGSASREACAS